MKPSQSTTTDIFNPAYDDNLICRAQNGDRLAQTELFFIYKPMIKAIAKKKSLGMNDEQEDLYSYLSLEFLVALQKYNKDKSDNFSLYLAATLSYKSIKLYKAHRDLKDKETIVSVEEFPEFIHIESGYDDIFMDNTIIEILRNLSIEEKILVKARFIDKMTYRKIADKYGVSHVAVMKKMDKLLTKIHAQLKDSNYIF